MSRIFLTNATGYIGFAVAKYAREKGYEVTALARSDSSAAKLQEHGITVQHGDLRNPSSYIEAVRSSDIVIHTAATNDADYSRVDQETTHEIINALKGSNKTFIYTSGIWVLGSTGNKPVAEDAEINPLPAVAWRPEVEKKVINAAKDGIKTLVVRPGLVYGQGGGIVAKLYVDAKKLGEISYIGNGENHWSLVHVDDVARVYIDAIDKATAGTILHATNDKPVKQREVVELIAKAAGVPDKVRSIPVEEARKQIGFFADGLVLDQHIQSTHTKRIVGWEPKAAQIDEELSKNVKAFVSSKG